MNRFTQFITNLDARAVRSVLVSLGLFAVVAVILIIGKTTAVFDSDDAPFLDWLQANADSPWALLGAIALFTGAAFLGAPQWVLIAATVVAFGATRGAIYSWAGTMVAASVLFWLGRMAGADTLRRYGGDSANRLSAFIGRRGIAASFIIRFVPMAPAIIVNMAAGVSQMRFASFLLGTGPGIIPKIALVSFASGGLIELVQGDNLWLGVMLGALAALWLVVMLIARRALRGETAPHEEGERAEASSQSLTPEPADQPAEE